MNLFRLSYDSLPQKFTLLILRNFIPAKIEFANFEIASKLALLAFKDSGATGSDQNVHYSVTISN